MDASATTFAASRACPHPLHTWIPTNNSTVVDLHSTQSLLQNRKDRHVGPKQGGPLRGITL